METFKMQTLKLTQSQTVSLKFVCALKTISSNFYLWLFQLFLKIAKKISTSRLLTPMKLKMMVNKLTEETLSA